MKKHFRPLQDCTHYGDKKSLIVKLRKSSHRPLPKTILWLNIQEHTYTSTARQVYFIFIFLIFAEEFNLKTNTYSDAAFCVDESTLNVVNESYIV